MPAAPKVLLIGLDAAEPSLIRRWCEQGKLPNISSVAEMGSSTLLRSPAREFPDEVWPAIYASANSGELGKYFYIQPKRNSENLELVNDTPHGTPFWLLASEAGKRCAIVDAPKISAEAGFNGVQLANWGSHATHCDLATHPPELLDELLSKHGPYPIDACDNHGRSDAEYRRMRKRLLQGVRAQGELFRDVLGREPWDLFFCVFSQTHCSGHQFWHFQDQRHPDYREEPELSQAIEDVYRAVDAQIGALLAEVGPETHVMIVSGHGMTAQFHGRDLMPELLKLWGFDGPADKTADPNNERRVEIKPGLVAKLKRAIPIQFQYFVKRWLPKAIEDAIVCRVMGSKKLDSRARVNCVPNNDLNPALRVNLQGRDPHGNVAPGEDFERLLDLLERRLISLINPITGETAVRMVTRSSVTHPGANRDVLPDMTAMWKDDAWIGELYSPGFGTVAGNHRDLRTGGHDVDGFLAYRGPAEGLELESQIPDGKDVAPTVLDLLDVAIPRKMEGRSLFVRAAVGAQR